jgi:hypothetical protein
MTTVLALLGAKALYLLYIWLASAIIASVLSGRKGYGEKAGLATGLLTSAAGVVIWLAWPPKPDSRWARDPNSWLIAAAYLFAVLVPIIGIVLGVILLRKDDPAPSRHGAWAIVVAVVVSIAAVVSLVV